jgi:TPR repeat protein
MLRHAFCLVAALLALTSAAAAQQSWRERCRAAQGGSDPGMVEFCRGIAAVSGDDGANAPDEMAALKHYERAAELGFAEAQATLGNAFERGWHVPQDAATAATWYAKAAAQGHAGAELNLGNLYAKGDGVPRDMAKARELIGAAANQGLVQAKRRLAELDTEGGPPLQGAAMFHKAQTLYSAGDHAGAAELVRQAAEAGYPIAIYQIGYFYENGDGVPTNLVEAQRWYEKGAAIGEPRSEAALGLMYENGKPMRSDWVEAAKWYMKGAQQEHPKSELLLGRAYEYGIGVPLNLDTAITWYDKAAAQGEGQAAYFAKYLRENHGFDGSTASDEEDALLGPYRGHPWALMTPPTGRVFHNSGERLTYLRSWVQAGQAYEKCLADHRLASAGTMYTCPAPVPPED